MTEWMWVVLGVVIYLTGFGVMTAAYQIECGKEQLNAGQLPNHDLCNHAFEEPVPTLWPFAVVLGVFIAPFIIASTVFGYVVGGIEKRHHAKFIAQREQEQRDRERARRIAELEAELLPPLPQDDVDQLVSGEGFVNLALQRDWNRD